MCKLMTSGAAALFLMSAVWVGGAEAQTVDADNAAMPVAMPQYDWSGAYVGLQLGYAYGDANGTASIPSPSNINGTAAAIAVISGNDDMNPAGFLAGGQAGYNWQSGNIVFGVEADIAYVDMDDSHSSGIVGVGGATGRTTDQLDMNMLGTVRGRLGYAADRWLVYGTAGLAFTDATVKRTLDWSFADSCPPVDSGLRRCHVGEAKFNTGYALGGGVEYALTQAMTVKVEYLYTDFGDANFTTTNAGIANQYIDHSFSLNTHVVKVGLNYKF